MRLYLALLLIGVACASQVRFDGFKVFRVIPENVHQVESLKHLEDSNLGYDFWISPAAVNKAVDVMVPPHLLYNFQDFLELQNLNAEIFIDNVQDRIDNERAPMQNRAMDWDDYHTLDEIYDWLDSLASNPNVEVLTPGLSFEGRVVKGVKITFPTSGPGVFIEGGIHSREWISHAVTTYTIDQILNSQDAAVRATVERYTWYIFPVFNPDGYVYSHTTNRMWRKTRVPYNGCYGADPNRNWDYRWNTGGASSNPCSETYPGPYPFSEPEMASMGEYIATIVDSLDAYISFHSYSQLLLLPFGHTSEHLANYDELKLVGDNAMAVLQSFFGTSYTVGNIVEVLYVATGTSMDYIKGTYDTRITYTYELRDTGTYGFVLPADQIMPSCIETFPSIMSILDQFWEMK